MHNRHETYVKSLVQRFEQEKAAGNSPYFDAEEFEDIAVYYIEGHELEKAAEVLRRGDAIHPGNSGLTLCKAELCIERLEPEKAISLIETLPQDEYDTKLVRASAWLDMNRQEDAIKLLWSLVNDSRKDKDLVCLDASFLLKVRSLWEEALEVLEVALPDYPHNMDLYSSAVECCCAMGQMEKCIPYINHILDEDPYNVRAWAQLGECHCTANRFEEAIEAYEYALAATTGKPDYLLYILLGHAYAQKGNYQTALEYYSKALPDLKIDSEKNEVLGCMGEAYEKLEDWNQAIAFYEKALISFPYDEQAFLGIGICQLELSHWMEALNAFDRVLQLNPKNEEVWTCLGDLYVDTQQYDEAITAYQHALDFNPDQPDIWLTLGHLHFESNLLKESLSHYFKAAELNPDLPFVYIYIALCYKCMGENKEAEKALELAIEKDPQARGVYDKLIKT